jgi:hypothetical protein
MTVRKKAEKKIDESSIDEIISRGGSTTGDKVSPEEAGDYKMTLRIPKDIYTEMEKNRKSRVGTVYKNQWILEAIAEKLNKEVT